MYASTNGKENDEGESEENHGPDEITRWNRKNREAEDFLDGDDIVRFIKAKPLRWFCHVKRRVLTEMVRSGRP